jgi:glutathione reductase (NADPH)
MLYRGDQILRGFDGDVRQHVADGMRARGVIIEIQRDVAGIERADGELRVTLDNGETHPADQVLFATGRNPHTAGLGLRELGVGIAANGAVQVDAWSQTAVPSIFAVGDVTDRVALTPVAIHEAQAFADTLFGATPTKSDHALIPTAVFTQPEVGVVGATEAEAREQGAIEVYRAVFRPLLYTMSGRDERMLMKLVVAADSRRVVGVHVVGQGAAELVQLAAVALRMGATKEDFDRTMPVHPTAAEELVTMRAPEPLTT